MRRLFLGLLIAFFGAQGHAGTIISSYSDDPEDPGNLTVMFSYINPTITKTEDPPVRDKVVSWSKGWAGSVEIHLDIDGFQYSGTGTGQGEVYFDDLFVYDGSVFFMGYRETVSGLLENGSSFYFTSWLVDLVGANRSFRNYGTSGLYANPQEWYLQPEAFVDDSLLGQFSSVTQISAVPLPASALTLLAAIVLLFGISRRRQKRPPLDGALTVRF